MASSPSNFVWYELHTPDAALSTTFYRSVFPWTTHEDNSSGKPYQLLMVGESPVGGILEKPATAFTVDVRSSWVGYLGVADVDEFAERIQQVGGTLHRAGETLPGVGRFAVVADPQGAIFVLFQPLDPQQRPPELPPAAPGTFAWHDLAAADGAAAFDFYATFFGWHKADAIDMGSSGVYQIFTAGANPIGGIMTRMDSSQKPGWLYYVNVADIDEAIARVKDAGGRITHGPSVVPGGQRIAHALDPLGAVFGMVSPS